MRKYLRITVFAFGIMLLTLMVSFAADTSEYTVGDTFRLENESGTVIEYDKAFLEKKGDLFVAGKSGTTTVRFNKYINGVYTQVGSRTIVISEKAAIELDKVKLTLGVGETRTMKYTLSGGEPSSGISWRSSNPDTLTVSDGRITAIKEGAAVITATTANGCVSSCNVTVKPAPETVSIVRTLVLGVGETRKLKITFNDNSYSYKKVYSSENKAVASFSKGAVVTAVSVGETTIGIETFNGKISNCLVKVVPAPKKAALNQKSISLYTDRTATLIPSFDSSIEYDSYTIAADDCSICTVSENGRIVPKKPGKTTIRVKTYNGLTAVCPITIKKAPTEIVLNRKSVALGKGEKYSLQFSFDSKIGINDYSVKSNNEKTAIISKNGVIEAKETGTAKIVIETYNGKKAVFSVNVKAAPSKVSLNRKSIVLGAREEYKITASVPENSASGEIAFVSSNNAVCSVSKDGTVKPLKAGKAKITAKTYNGKTAFCNIEVKKAPSYIKFKEASLKLGVGERLSMEYTLPKGTYSNRVTFTSSDKKILSVSSKGTVSATKVGSATVTVRTYNGKTSKCKIRVYNAPASISCASYTLYQGRKIVPEIYFNKGQYANRIALTSSDPSVVSISDGRYMWAKAIGSATVRVKTYNGKKTSFRVDVIRMAVPFVSQTAAGYPTGCEAACCAAILQYYGYNISCRKMVETIPRENVVIINGRRYGPDINEKFVGNPAAGYTSASPGYGAFSPCITKSLNKALKNVNGKHKATKISGCTFNELLNTVSKGHPVIVWATYQMFNPSTVNSWYIPNGDGTYRYYSYPRGTHVLVLEGVSENYVYLMDPILGHVSYTKSAFKSKWALLGKQGVILERK